MTLLTRYLAVGSAATLFTGVVGAQLQPIDYTNHYQPNAEIVSIAFSGPGLFGAFTGSLNFAGPGDAIRRCYDEAQTQGGRNQSFGMWESTTFQVAQGFQAGGPGVDIGLVSFQAGTESDLGGDVCFSPFLSSAGNTGGHQVAAAAVIGVIGGTAPYPFPYVFDITFQWGGTTAGGGVIPNFTGFGAPITKGTQTSTGNPLLVNVIYEVQGPINGGVTNNQYFLASSTETTGQGGGSTLAGTPSAFATGGVTNGNRNWGSSLFGVDATQSGAISHSRLFAFDGANFVAGIPGTFGGFFASAIELNAIGGFHTPGLWGINDGNEGAGGLDWRISTNPVSVVNLRFQDHLSGAQTNSNILFKAGGSGPAAQAFDPTLIFNQSFFLFSATPAAAMQQSPFSWDDLGGVVPAQPGSIILGSQITAREGAQTVPINFDSVTAAFLNFPFVLGQPFIGSDNIFAGDVVGAAQGGATLAGTTSFFEGFFDNGYAVASPTFPSNQNIVSGTSRFSGTGLGDVPVGGNANPNAAGARLGVVGIGLQLRTVGGGIGPLQLTEFSNAATIVLQ